MPKRIFLSLALLLAAAGLPSLPQIPPVPTFGPIPNCHIRVASGTGSLATRRTIAETCLGALRDHVGLLDSFDRGLFKYVEQINALYLRVSRGPYTYQQKKGFWDAVDGRNRLAAQRRTEIAAAQTETRRLFYQVRTALCRLQGSIC